ncbi:MAG: DUF11 domain-containing protein [Clostridia bacterium]|nr:DUF11 domain-containing protein [Clostridia bacterium]
MAIFQNQATITFGGVTRASNITVGEIVDAVGIVKTATPDTYAQGGRITYVVNIQNTGGTPLTGLTVTDDLGSYETDGDTTEKITAIPLTYVDGSARLFTDGVEGPAPQVTAGTALTFEGIDVPANGVTTLVYLADVNEYAPLGEGGQIENTAAVTGTGVTGEVSDTAVVTAEQAADLSIVKSVNPTVVTENSLVTYTFEVQNTGAATTEEDGVVIHDTFSPVLTDLTVTLNGVTLTPDQYVYDETTGEFATADGVLSIPGASYTQDPATGVWTVDPGTATLTVSGII